MDWESYEGIVKDIYEGLGEAVGIEIMCWGKGCRIEGKSGVNHQIDVLASHSDGIHSYKTAIECKYWNKKVNKDVVAKLSEIIEDAQIEKGIVVSRSGFTRDAVTFARHRNVGLVELRRPTDKDWIGRIKDIHILVHIWVPEVYNYVFLPAATQNIQSISALTSDIFIQRPDGTSTSLDEITNGTLKNDTHLQRNEERRHSVTFPDGSMLSVPTSNVRQPIKEIRFNVRYSHVPSEEIVIRGEDHVFMIMLAIFENKRFAISHSGEIRESELLPGESS